MKRQRRILVVRTDRVGDLVLATPLIRALRQTFPDAYLGAMTSAYAGSVLQNNPRLDTVIADDGDGSIAGFRRLVAAITTHRFDTALLLLPTKRLAWALLLSGIQLRIGVGRKPYQMLALMRLVDRHRHGFTGHEADLCMDLGRAIGVSSENMEPELFLTEREQGEGRAALERTRTGEHDRGAPAICWVLIHASCGASSPNWSPARYRELALLLLEDRSTGVVIGTGNQPDVFTLPAPRVADFRGTLSLRQLMALIANCRAVVTSSTGPMHIAAALKVPTVALFCPLPPCSPKLWGPLGNRAEVILPEAAFCQRECQQDTHGCLFDGGILPETVRRAVRTLLPGAKPSPPSSTCCPP